MKNTIAIGTISALLENILNIFLKRDGLYNLSLVPNIQSATLVRKPRLEVFAP